MRHVEASPTRVLLVEDDPDLRESLAFLLEDEGYLVLTARDGRQALRLHQRHHADVVVSDVVMPLMGGLELLASLREAKDDTPLLLMSSFAAYLEKGRAAGAAATLHKPFDVEELLGAVKSSLHQVWTPSAPITTGHEVWEEERLRAIERLQLEEWQEHPALDALLEDLRRYLNAPVALFSLVTRTEQRWAVRAGDWQRLSPTARGPREDSFCRHAVESTSPLLVQDAQQDAVFRQNPIVCTKGLQFYAGVPVHVYAGLPVGSLCVLGFSPRTLHHVELGVLQAFGKALEGALERRAVELGADQNGAWPGHARYFDSEWGLLGGAALQDLARLHNRRPDKSGRGNHCVLLRPPPETLATLIPRLRTERGLLVRLQESLMAWLALDTSRGVVAELCEHLCGPGCDYVIGTFDGRPESAPELLTSLELNLPRQPG
ncbi:MAG: response regulator [Myxococcota bacterium]